MLLTRDSPAEPEIGLPFSANNMRLNNLLWNVNKKLNDGNPALRWKLWSKHPECSLGDSLVQVPQSPQKAKIKSSLFLALLGSVVQRIV